MRFSELRTKAGYVIMGIGALFPILVLARSTRSPSRLYSLTLFDDAMISMTYARTLARTGELVWYPGATRVQGFTNGLWTVWMAIPHLLTATPSVAISFVVLTSLLALIASAVTIFRIFILIGRLDGQDSARLALPAAVTVALTYSTVFWALRGMEVGVLALLVTLLIGQLIKFGHRENKHLRPITNHAVLVGASTLGVLVRLDFLVITVALSLASLALASRSDRFASIYLCLIPSLLAGLLVVVGQSLYYGSARPNTYYLKVDGVAVIERLRVGLLYSYKILPIVLTLLVALWTVRSDLRSTARAQFIALTTAAWLATAGFSVYVGGDAWEFDFLINRYLSVVLPLTVPAGILLFTSPSVGGRVKLPLLLMPFGSLAGALFLLPPITETGRVTSSKTLNIMFVVISLILVWHAAKVKRVAETSGHSRLLILIFPLVFSAILAGLTQWVEKGGLHTYDDATVRLRSEQLHEITSEDAVIATVWAGAPAYYSERQMVDLLGKSDPIIARLPIKGAFYPGHNKWDYSYSIGELQPDLVTALWADPPTDAQMGEWGYSKWCPLIRIREDPPIWLRHNSTSIRFELLDRC